MFRWGILGGATIAKEKVIPAIKKQGGTVVAIASLSGSNESLSKICEIEEIYNNYEELLANDSIEIIYIALPNHLHFEWSKKSLQSGKHVLCEKPLSTKTSEVEELVELAQKNKRIIFEGFMYQYHPQIIELKNMIEQKEIGEINIIRMNFHFCIKDKIHDIRMKKEFQGGAMNDVGCYLVHLYNSIFNGDFGEINVITIFENSVDVQTSIQIKRSGNQFIQLDCGFLSEMEQTLKIVGTKGTVYLPNVFRPDICNGVGEIQMIKNGEKLIRYFMGDSYELQINEVHRRMKLNEFTDQQVNALIIQANALQHIQELIKEEFE